MNVTPWCWNVILVLDKNSKSFTIAAPQWLEIKFPLDNQRFEQEFGIELKPWKLKVNKNWNTFSY